MPRILIVDDQLVFLKVLDKLLKGQGYQTVTACNGLEALAVLESSSFDIMISDIRMQPLDGLALLRQTRMSNPQMSVIMLTACDTLEAAIQSMKLGAFDYLTKPVEMEELTQTVRRALEYSHITMKSKPMRVPLHYEQAAGKISGMVAQSKPMQKVCTTIERIAPTGASVLICGEKGTGKELAARNLHRHSPRQQRPFLKVDCASLHPELLEAELFGFSPDLSSNKKSLFDAAAGGSLYIHEIGALSLEIQDELLETLQERHNQQARNSADVSVRIFASSTTNLQPRVHDGSFRQELYRQLSAIRIDIPPLRNRTEDLLPLISLVLQRTAHGEEKSLKLDGDAAEILKNYRWPGNVNQLETVLQEAISLQIDGVITRASLPEELVTEVLDSLELNKTASREELKGKSLKAFLRAKGEETRKKTLEHRQKNMKDQHRVSRSNGTDTAPDDSDLFDWM